MSKFQNIIATVLGSKAGANQKPAAAENAPTASAEEPVVENTEADATAETPASDNTEANTAVADGAPSQSELAAFETGRETESKRVAAIFGCDDAKDRPALAQKLAADRNITVDSALTILGAAAKENQGPGLSSHMDMQAGTEVTAEGGEPPKDKGAEMASLLKATGSPHIK